MNTKYQATILNGDYLGVNPILLNFPCEIHFTRFGNKQFKLHSNMSAYEKINFVDKTNYKVFVSCNEPTSSSSREEVNHVINNYFQYDLILTTDDEVLKNTSNSVFFPYGTTWLNKSKHHPDAIGEFAQDIINQTSNKTFNVSFVTTNRRFKEGYELRHKIWNNKNLINIPTIFYSSTRDITTTGGYSQTLHNGLLPNDDKINLFKSQYSIAIESTKEKSYFSEKLIDCLLTKTVPIYWGAPDIGEFFDIRGFITFDSFDEFLIKVNSINETTYESMKPYIDANFEKAKEYGRSFFSRIQDKIEEQWKLDNSKTDKLWTIGILTIPERKDVLNRILNHLNDNTPERYKNRIEIIVNEDNKEHTIGYKRQEVLEKAKGKYISFIDDDDMVSISYISKIADILNTEKYDGVGFLGIFYENKIPMLLFSHSNTNTSHYLSDDSKIRHRPLNHLNPVLLSIAKTIGYSDLNFGEDMDYCDKLSISNLIKKQNMINEVLYHYLFDDNKSKTHTRIN